MTAEERKQSAYEIAYDAMDLFDNGWRASDREELKERYDLTDWEADVMADALGFYDAYAKAQKKAQEEDKDMTTYDINGIEVTKEQLLKLADYVTRRTGNFCGISMVSLPDDEDIADYLAENGVPVEDGMYYVDRGEAGDFPASKDADALLPALAREVEAAFPSRRETAEALKRA